MTPYYSHAGITVYHGNAMRFFMDDLHRESTVMVTDPPFGIEYYSNWDRCEALAPEIKGDADTTLRDLALAMWGEKPALIFGSWKVARPVRTKMLLVWDTGGALGMGDLSLPWKPSHQEIYVIGSGFKGNRDTDVLRFPPVQSTARNGRTHPHEKPVDLLKALIQKCPDGAILDPFMGSGTTLVAAKNLGRKAIGIEIEERYCEIAAKRLSQEVFQFTKENGQ
jgi:hypothetical protein